MAEDICKFVNREVGKFRTALTEKLQRLAKSGHQIDVGINVTVSQTPIVRMPVTIQLLDVSSRYRWAKRESVYYCQDLVPIEMIAEVLALENLTPLQRRITEALYQSRNEGIAAQIHGEPYFNWRDFRKLLKEAGMPITFRQIWDEDRGYVEGQHLCRFFVALPPKPGHK